MRLRATKTAALEHRAYFLRSFPGCSMFVAAARQGPISFIDLFGDAATATVRVLPGAFGQIQSLSPHASKPQVALIENGVLVLLGLDGTRHLTVQEDSRGEFTACAFDPNDPYLWCVVRRSLDVVEVQLRDEDSGTLLFRQEQRDPYADSDCSLHFNTPNPGAALWLAGGQDGQQIYWLSRSSEGIQCVKEPALEDTSPPVFSPQGTECLVLGESGEASLNWFTYPAMEPLGIFPCPWEDEGFGSAFCYLDGERALINSSEQRLFVLDLNSKTILEEVMIEGHEPQLARVYYPLLADESELCTDILGFERFGDWIIAEFRHDGRVGSGDWKGTLLCFRIESF